MGLLQKAIETYDAHRSLIGVEREGHQTLSPVAHKITGSDIEITLQSDGSFYSARTVGKDEPKIVIPVTEESAGRTSGDCAHPLCDQLCYLAPYNKNKHSLYLDGLTAWSESEHSHPMLEPILNYVRGGTILSDLSNAGLIELDEHGIPLKEKLLVRWRVYGANLEEDRCWCNRALFDSFFYWYTERRSGTHEKEICMVSGEPDVPAEQHMKGIIPEKGNAKLLSANDHYGFTFRGRFTDEAQAARVGYIASQKAHCALTWLAAEQGTHEVFGGRSFLFWNPQGLRVSTPSLPLCQPGEPITEPSDYREELKRTLQGFKNELAEKLGSAREQSVVIAVFDAATSGRLSLVYYNELQAPDFLERLYKWDMNCCWYTDFNGIRSPTLRQIVNCAFGVQRVEKGSARLVTDDKLFCQQMQRLIACRVDCAGMPADIEKAIVNRAGTLHLFDPGVQKLLLSTACAVIKKYYYDHRKETIEMSLDPDRNDRSYQFGRLLAVMEKVERDTYSYNNEEREPGAIRMQSVFCQRPLYTAGILQQQLDCAYFPRLSAKSRGYYRSLIGQIMEKIDETPDAQHNAPLKDTYLIGYYLQRRALYASNKKDESEEN